ncbi:MAG: DUF503 domain-containing protein [Candidatus Lernaella stagnicola]|nr:DUF503 domain-containing protein [Candidatus Lernaella stagnicola]
MTIGALKITLLLHGCHTLKEKRMRVRPILAKVRAKFHVAVAEVEHQNVAQMAGVAFVTVSDSGRVANATCDKIVDFVESLGLAEVGNTEMELIHF